MILDQSQELLQFKTRHRDDRRTVIEACVQDDHQPVDVKEREHTDELIVIADLLNPNRLADVCHQVVVREHDPLREARGPAGIGHGDQVLARVNGYFGYLPIVFHQRSEWGGAFSFPKNEDFFNPGLLSRL